RAYNSVWFDRGTHVVKSRRTSLVVDPPDNYQIVQSPGYVTILVEMNHEVRVIPLDGRPHLPPNIRQWTGDSRGHWEGGTLGVDTTNFTFNNQSRFGVGYLDGMSDQNLHV